MLPRTGLGQATRRWVGVQPDVTLVRRTSVTALLRRVLGQSAKWGVGVQPDVTLVR
jgi:hypothetical protein